MNPIPNHRLPGPHRAGPSAGARPSPAAEPPVRVIARHRGWRVADLADLWAHRELLWFLVWRDIKVHYKQTVLGAAWAVLRPLAFTVVMSLFMGALTGGTVGGLPAPLFFFSGFLAWGFFAATVASASGSVLANQNLLTKVYFPRLLLPLSAPGEHLLDLAMGFVMLVAMMLYYGASPGPEILLVPLLVFHFVLLAVGVGTLLSALAVAYRDFRYLVPFLIQLWMFATPGVFIDLTAVREFQPDSFLNSPLWRNFVMPLNPAYGLVTNFRAAVLGQPLDLPALGVSGLVTLAFLACGLLYFRRVERNFADVI
jgi:lipopolysaccharide transport system permease protein